MLTSLSLANYGLFRDLAVEFGPGFTAVSGESGAGKSLLIQSLPALLGERWDQSRMGAFGDRVRIGGVFALPPESPVWTELEAFAIEPDDYLSVSREVTPDGRSLFRAQGQVVPRQAVRSLAPWLVDILSQGAVSRMASGAFQLEWLDRTLGLSLLRAETDGAFRDWQRCVEEERRAGEEGLDDATAARLEEDLATIEEVSPEAGEDERLSADLVRVRGLRRLQEGFREAMAVLSEEGEGTPAQRLRQAARTVQAMTAIDENLNGVGDGLVELVERLSDLRYQFERWWDALEIDPWAVERIEARADAIAQLKRRFGPDLDDVLAARERLTLALERHHSGEAGRKALRDAVRAAYERYREPADRLAQRRRAGAEEAALRLRDLLRQMEMQAAEVAIRLEETEPHRFGTDQITVLFSANRGLDLMPLGRTASGGELARVVLAMTVMAQDLPEAALVFDEVDAGLGGVSAARVGELLADLGRRAQVIAVTHQPTVASRAGRHLVVMKLGADGRTEARAAPVEGEARTREIARMLSGEVHEAALEHARELLGGDRTS